VTKLVTVAVEGQPCVRMETVHVVPAGNVGGDQAQAEREHNEHGLSCYLERSLRGRLKMRLDLGPLGALLATGPCFCKQTTFARAPAPRETMQHTTAGSTRVSTHLQVGARPLASGAEFTMSSWGASGIRCEVLVSSTSTSGASEDFTSTSRFSPETAPTCKWRRTH
jgi:hypothetical protein